MFRITRGISLDHSPAFPNPSLRFPTGLPIQAADEDAAPSPAESSNEAAPAASGESPSTEPP
jgi:hypothetical protein